MKRSSNRQMTGLIMQPVHSSAIFLCKYRLESVLFFSAQNMREIEKFKVSSGTPKRTI